MKKTRDDVITELTIENQNMKAHISQLEEEISVLQQELTKWEHCHRQDMADNLRLRNQIAILMGWDPVNAVEGGTTDEGHA